MQRRGAFADDGQAVGGTAESPGSSGHPLHRGGCGFSRRPQRGFRVLRKIGENHDRRGVDRQCSCDSIMRDDVTRLKVDRRQQQDDRQVGPSRCVALQREHSTRRLDLSLLQRLHSREGIRGVQREQPMLLPDLKDVRIHSGRPHRRAASGQQYQ